MFFLLIFILINLFITQNAQNHFSTSHRDEKNNGFIYPQVNRKDLKCNLNSVKNNCKSELKKYSWKLEQSSLASNVPEIITDKRWEKFKTYKIEPNNYKSVPIGKNTTNIPISIRMKNEVEILLCDGPEIYNCIGFKIWDAHISFYVIKNHQRNITGYQEANLTDEHWKHFLIERESKSIIRISGYNIAVPPHHFPNVIPNIDHIIFNNTENTEGFFKIHNYSYFSQTNKNVPYYVNLGKPINGFSCISMVVRSCNNCWFTLSLNHEEKSLKLISNTTWTEIQMSGDIINDDTVNLKITLKSKKVVRSPFWNIADIELCQKHEQEQTSSPMYNIKIIALSVVVSIIAVGFFIIIGYVLFTRCMFKKSCPPRLLLLETSSEQIDINSLNCNNINIAEPLYAEIYENPSISVVNEIYTGVNF